MDKLTIEQLSLTVSLGVHDWEKQQTQEVFADIEIPMQVEQAVATDELEDTLDYTRLVDVIQKVASARHYNLVESLAESIAMALLREFELEKVKVTIDKPSAIPEAESTRITITRPA